MKRFCKQCDKAFIPFSSNVKKGYGIYCSRACYGRSLNKGGCVNKDGYRIICNDGVYHKEHRLVMEQFLGRELLRSEHLHHKNGDRLDNRIENLDIMSCSEHIKREWELGSMANSLKNLELSPFRQKARIDL